MAEEFAVRQTALKVLRLEAWPLLDGYPELCGRKEFQNCRRPGKWNSVHGRPWPLLAPTPKHPASEPLTLSTAWERSEPLAFTCSQIVFKNKQASAISSAFFLWSAVTVLYPDLKIINYTKLTYNSFIEDEFKCIQLLLNHIYGSMNLSNNVGVAWICSDKTAKCWGRVGAIKFIVVWRCWDSLVGSVGTKKAERHSHGIVTLCLVQKMLDLKTMIILSV